MLLGLIQESANPTPIGALRTLTLGMTKPPSPTSNRHPRIRFIPPAWCFFVQSAWCHLRAGRLSIARHAYRKAHEKRPFHSDVYALKGVLDELDRLDTRYETCMARENWRGAKATYQECLKIYQSQNCQIPPRVLRWRIEVMLMEGTALDEIEREIQKHLTQNRSLEMLCLLSLVKFLKNQFQESLDRLKEILHSDCDNPDAQRLRTNVKRIASLWNDAEKALNESNWLQANDDLSSVVQELEPYKHQGKGGPVRARVFYQRAIALKKLGKYEDAARDIAVCLSITPNDFDAVRLRAFIYMDLELYDTAVPDFTSALELAPPCDRNAVKTELTQAQALKAKPRDWHKLLDLSPTCTKAQIKRAYHVQSLKQHPDNGGLPELFNAITEAYQVLTDETRREHYDRSVYYSRIARSS